jgi:hypothetical protein
VYICPVCQCTYTHPGNFKQHLLKHEREQQQQQQQRPLESSHLNNVLQSAFGKQEDRKKQALFRTLIFILKTRILILKLQ